MKLFAPRADWNVRSDQSWWGYVGGMPTSSGVSVSQSIAMTLSAWTCGLRIISEATAQLPCQLVEHVGERVTRKADDHPLYYLLLDQPNREQDAMCWFDMQTAFLPAWGNSYSEIQRDSTGRIVNLWPIHPSRIPLRNITRNSTNPDHWNEIIAGQPGEIVYYVNNDDGSATAIPASDMLHVPGVLSDNGITGQSLVKWGANSLGIALATERHAGAFYRNGAVSNMAIKSPKIVGKDTADRLRYQWQQTFGGADNHYKTLLLEDGMEPVPINMNPQDSQLIESRKFGVNEIARWLRLPPHMLADLERATFSNIEQQSLDFVIYALSPWLKRWTKALKRQLLTPEEKQRMFFQFDLSELLKADSAARASYLQFKFNTGSASPNDIRAADGENPVEGGDTYFVQSNNYMPLNMVEDMAEAQIAKLSSPSPAPSSPQSTMATEGPDEEDDDVEVEEHRVAEALRKLAERIEKAPTIEDVRRLVGERETQDAERLAVRETEARKVAAAARDCLLISLTATIDGWQGYEHRAATRAAQKPQTFLSWRDEFYPSLKNKIFESLKPFAMAAEPIGYEFDAMDAADAYVSQSIADIEPLADLSCDRLAEGVANLSQSWADRPKQFAESLLQGATCAK